MRVRAETAAQRGQLASVAVAVVDAVDHRPLEAHPSMLRRRGSRSHASIRSSMRVAPVDRDQLVAQRVVGGVQRHGEVHRQRSLGERADPGDDADRRDRDVPRREAEVAVEALDRLPTPVSRLAIGSPMPMNTMLLTRRSRRRARCDARTTCSTISPTVRWRVKPACPVAQKPQPMAQPAWLLTHTVARSGYSISTVSTRLAAVEFPQELDRVAAVAHRLGDRRERQRAARRRVGSAAPWAGS